MPIVLVQSGPSFMRGEQQITPMAMERTCEDCGSPAPFGITKNGKTLAYCGWRTGEPVCNRREVKTEAA